MRIMFVNNEGGGFVGEKEIDNNMTVEEFLQREGFDAARYTIRVDRQPVMATHVLREGMRLSLSPSKVAGA